MIACFIRKYLKFCNFITNHFRILILKQLPKSCFLTQIYVLFLYNYCKIVLILQMGNRISATSEPVIMTEAFLREKIVQKIVSTEDLDVSEFQKLIKTDGLENDLVFSLDLENQSNSIFFFL